MARVVKGVMALFEPLDASVVTLGVFDGMHIGHQALVRRAVELARSSNVAAVVYTFDPHPAKVLAPEMAPRTLMSIDERIRLMGALGVDLVVVEPFDRVFAGLEADEWLERYLVARLHPRHVVVGFNFTYGKRRGGHPEHLRGPGLFEVEVLGPVEQDGIVASSTKVREFLLEGNVRGARALLGRDFAITGTVVKGDERGKKIGFPTANVEPDHELIPEPGVYATRAAVVRAPGSEMGGRSHLAVTNIGFRPTFRAGPLTVESHLLDFDGDLYGARLSLALVERLRPEKRFAGVEDLKTQIERDVAAARALFARLDGLPARP